MTIKKNIFAKKKKKNEKEPKEIYKIHAAKT